MYLRQVLYTFAAAITGVTLMAGSAMAYSATSTTALNVRSGPSTDYRVVDTLYAGEEVNVERCSSSRNWCYITHTGPDGWVSARYLNRTGGGNTGGNGNDYDGGTAVNYTARATVALNVRSGPGTGYRVVDALYRGERVNVERCSGSWCYITHDGPDGWVAARYLSRTSGGGDTGGNQNEPGFSVEFGSDGEFSFSIGNRPEPEPDENDQACFYRDFAYGGPSFCLEKGEGVSLLQGSWNDSISSIRVEGDVQVTACMHANFGGNCIVTDKNIRSLGANMNDEISSIQVR
ncbi:SH3 domain-containing protein [Maritalea mediterranea]|uniref:SH3 domain-containing protein n=1 Tax=Maritalea mediterranea TaxID=2909667 RepID=A0ABS9E862_9HYPH|nr:SH3 domain-containing protein [Maritalea mediterranea]MCF4099036.1 SH3 domain-containing protein [Maritalea mediterranea]